MVKKMKYDHGRKIISRHTGLTGVESKNIAKKLDKMGIDYQRFDWKAIGEDTRDFGNRSSSVKNKLKSMYGVSLDNNPSEKHMNMSKDVLLTELNMINERRKPRAIEMDMSKQAKRTFKPTNEKGVKKWKKHPNRFDIIGVDDLFKF